MSELLSLFGDNDAIVVVDDNKGAQTNLPRAPASFWGRVFLRSDFEELGDLCELLTQERAHEWHASRSSQPNQHATVTRNLFTSESFDLILNKLAQLRSPVLFQDVPAGDFESPRIKEQQRKLSEQNGLSRPWKATRHSRALLHFLTFGAVQLHERVFEERVDVRMRFICDRMDWAQKELPPLPSSPTRDAARLHLGAEIVRDPKGAATLLNCLFGLVDSELNAYHAFVSEIRDEFLDARDVGGPAPEQTRLKEIFENLERSDVGARKGQCVRMSFFDAAARGCLILVGGAHRGQHRSTRSFRVSEV